MTVRRLDQLEENELVRQAQLGNRRAEDILVRAHMPLVYSIVAKFVRVNDRNRDDLIQEGSLGLLKAIRQYKFNRKAKLTTYATWMIRRVVLRAYYRNRLIYIPEYLHDLSSLVRKMEDDLVARGLEPDRSLIAQELGQSVETVTYCLFPDAISLDALAHNSGDPDYLDKHLKDGSDGQEDNCYLDDRLSEIVTVWNKISERRRAIFLCHLRGMSLREIGSKFKLTPEGVRVNVMRTVSSLKDLIRKQDEAKV